MNMMNDASQISANILDAAEAETLTGDIRDSLLAHVRDIRVPWAMLAEDEQQDKIDALGKMAESAVRRIASIIAQKGFPSIVAAVGKWTVKDGIKLELTASGNIDNITKLAEHGARSAVLVLSEPGDYLGERAPAKPDKDEPELPMDEKA